MDWASFLAERPLGVLATVGADGTPHAVPVEVVVRDGRVFVWTKGDSVKARNVVRTGRAALVAYKGSAAATVRGPARVITSVDELYAAVTAEFLAKYAREDTYGNDTLVEITPERVSAWEE